MPDFFEIKSLSAEDGQKLAKDIERRIADKIKDGTLSEQEVHEIEEMRLRPLPDIQDVQVVYEDILFGKKT